MAVSVELPGTGALIEDFVRALFLLDAGDVKEVAKDEYDVDLNKFSTKLKLILSRRGDALNRAASLLGWPSADKQCGGLRDLAQRVAEDPKPALNQLKRTSVAGVEGSAALKWGWGKMIRTPLTGGLGRDVKSYARFIRRIELSCEIAGLAALGMAATYLRGGVKEGHIYFLVPTSPVKYTASSADVCCPAKMCYDGGCLYNTWSKLDCDMPEALPRLLLYSLVPWPGSSFEYLKLSYAGDEVDVAWELSLANESDLLLSLLWRPGAGDLRRGIVKLAEEYCSCKKEAGGEGCRSVERLAKALADFYTFAATGDVSHLESALATAARELGSHELAKRLYELFADAARWAGK